MKHLLVTLALILFTSNASHAFERPFRIDRYHSTVKGYAVAWGIPGKNTDFEWLDTLSDEEIQQNLDIDGVRNFVVDIQTNQILTTIYNEDAVDFSIGSINYGNHYSVTLTQFAVQNVGYGTDVIGVVENYKWANGVSKILLVNTDEPKVKVVELKAETTMKKLEEKLKLSILAANMDLFENGASNIYEVKKEFLENVGEVNVITFDYSHPKQDTNSLEVVATVKMKYENGAIVPYILSVKQRQY